MAHPCPQGWSYETHARRKKLRHRVEEILKRVRSQKADAVKLACDSRTIHGEMFKDMTPPHFTYYAGHYRGEPFRCLSTCEAFVPGDARVGAASHEVLEKMSVLSELIEAAITATDAMVAGSQQLTDDAALHIVELSCRVFDLFLQVHPYANGNGHAARFIMWALLGRYGLWPIRWSVEPRPTTSTYMTLLLQHRAGDTQPFVHHVLTCINR